MALRAMDRKMDLHQLTSPVAEVKTGFTVSTRLVLNMRKFGSLLLKCDS